MTAPELLHEQHLRACDALEAAGPNSPTLCEGWTTRELAIHLWQLTHDPLAWLGMLPGLGKLAEQRMDHARRRRSFGEYIDKLRWGPDRFGCMPDDKFAEPLHSLGEWFIHTEDVLRADPDWADPEPYSADLQAALGRRLPVAAKALFLGKPGAVFRTPDGAELTVGRAPRVEVTGQPSELMLWAYGRRQVAQVVLRS